MGKLRLKQQHSHSSAGLHWRLTTFIITDSQSDKEGRRGSAAPGPLLEVHKEKQSTQAVWSLSSPLPPPGQPWMCRTQPGDTLGAGPGHQQALASPQGTKLGESSLDTNQTPPKTPQGPPLLSEAPQGPGGASTHGEHCPDPTDQSPGHTPSVSISLRFCPQRWSCDCTGVKCTGLSVWLPRFKSHHHLTATSPFSKPRFPPLLAGDNSGERVQTVDLLSILGTQ